MEQLKLDERIRKALYDGLRRLAEATDDKLEPSLANVFDPSCHWRISHPINEASGAGQAIERIWRPLKKALPDLERRDDIFVGGTYQGRSYIAALGHYCGTFSRDWLTIPPTGRPVFLRYGEVYQMEDGKVIQANLLWDILDLIRQSGFQLVPDSLGREGRWPGPLTADGVRFSSSDPVQSGSSISQTLAMHATLAEHNDQDHLTRESLISMPQKDHWHPKMMWYGPSGIGMTRGLAGFVDLHQLPFRRAFERPQGTFDEVNAIRAKKGAGHYIRIGDGPYSVTGGWPSVYAIHQGGNFAGASPTGRPVTMRVMDFYLHDGGLIRENWVPLDMLDLLKQMGVDLMERLSILSER